MIGRIIKLEKHSDADGSLVVVEKNKEKIGFDIKRVYYIYNTKQLFVRGKHAHKQLKQILICVHGSCKIHLDNGRGETEEVSLSTPDIGLIIESNVWREMYDFSYDCVLLVLASMEYDEKDYIRDYASFKKYVSSLQKGV